MSGVGVSDAMLTGGTSVLGTGTSLLHQELLLRLKLGLGLGFGFRRSSTGRKRDAPAIASAILGEPAPRDALRRQTQPHPRSEAQSVILEYGPRVTPSGVHC